jgi:hypothetical protein
MDRSLVTAGRRASSVAIGPPSSPESTNAGGAVGGADARAEGRADGEPAPSTTVDASRLCTGAGPDLQATRAASPTPATTHAAILFIGSCPSPPKLYPAFASETPASFIFDRRSCRSSRRSIDRSRTAQHRPRHRDTRPEDGLDASCSGPAPARSTSHELRTAPRACTCRGTIPCAGLRSVLPSWSSFRQTSWRTRSGRWRRRRAVPRHR